MVLFARHLFPEKQARSEPGDQHPTVWTVFPESAHVLGCPDFVHMPGEGLVLRHASKMKDER